jgi:hypothetical protein
MSPTSTMKLILSLSTLFALTRAFAPTAFMPRAAVLCREKILTASLGMAQMESDFATAMPEKPAGQLRDLLAERAKEFVDTVRGELAEGVEEPPELLALEAAYNVESDVQHLSQLIFELMIETGMQYDRDPETGILSPTNFDIKASLDVPEVKSEFLYLYTYGMNLISKGLIGMEELKVIVKERLIKRTGLTPEKFDEWLGF